MCEKENGRQTSPNGGQLNSDAANVSMSNHDCTTSLQSVQGAFGRFEQQASRLARKPYGPDVAANLAAALDDLVDDATEQGDVETLFALAYTDPPPNPLPRPRAYRGTNKRLFADCLTATRAWARLEAALHGPRLRAEQALDDIGRQRPELRHISPAWRLAHDTPLADWEVS